MNIQRESIFISALKSLCKTFAGVLGIALGFVVIFLVIAFASDNIDTPDKADLTVSADANWQRKLLPDSVPVLLKIDIHGIIGSGNLESEKFESALLDTRNGVLSGDRVKGILLHINSPGGLATDSAAIYRLLKEYKQKFKVPVYAFVDGLCASGGMYIASSADKILATPDSVIGSVGVRMGPNFNVAEAMDKLGIKSKTFTAGKDKDMLNPFRPWKEGEDASLQAILKEQYVQFVDVVTGARKDLSKEKLTEEYGAQVYVASTAKEYGYIDEVQGDYFNSLTQLAAASGIKEGATYQVLALEPHHPILKDLAKNKFSLLRGKITHTFPVTSHINSDMSGKILFLHEF